MRIVPAIIPRTNEEYERFAEFLHKRFPLVHVDVTDRNFLLPKISGAEVHLMVPCPEDVIDAWVKSGAERVIFHHEMTNKIEHVLNRVRELGSRAAVALELRTPIDAVEKYVSALDMVQLMSIAKIGEMGEPYDIRIEKKIAALHGKYPHIKIQLDGGITRAIAERVGGLGVESCVVGSHISEFQKS